MNILFAETLRKLRTERGISQEQLGKQLHLNRSTIARWENGRRLPDVLIIPRLAKCLGVDIEALYRLMTENVEIPNIIMVDDNEIVLSDGVAVLEEALPNAVVRALAGRWKRLNTLKQTGWRWQCWILSWARPAAWISAAGCTKSIHSQTSSF